MQSWKCDVCDVVPLPNITYAKNDNLNVHGLDVGLTMCKRFQNGSVNFTWRYMLCCSPEEQDLGVIHLYITHTKQLLVFQIVGFYMTYSSCTHKKIEKKWMSTPHPHPLLCLSHVLFQFHYVWGNWSMIQWSVLWPLHDVTQPFYYCPCIYMLFIWINGI